MIERNALVRMVAMTDVANEAERMAQALPMDEEERCLGCSDRMMDNEHAWDEGSAEERKKIAEYIEADAERNPDQRDAFLALAERIRLGLYR